MAQTLQIPNVAIKKVKFLQQEADREGISTERYLKGLIDEQMERVANALRATFDELAKPFRAALKNVSDEEIDQMVKDARKRHRDSERADRIKRASGKRVRPTFTEVTEPLRKAWGHLTGAQIDALVDKTRRLRDGKKSQGRARVQ